MGGLVCDRMEAGEWIELFSLRDKQATLCR